jgi:Homeodomain-like domain
MRTGVTVDVEAADRAGLEAIVADRNSPQKHVWRARIVLLTAAGLGTNEIMRRTSKSKTCLWRWQERFMQAGVEGLLGDKTRPSRVPPLAPAIGERVVALTQSDPPGETTHWTAAAMAGLVRISVSFGAAHLALAWPPAAPGTAVQTVARPGIHPQAA